MAKWLVGTRDNDLHFDRGMILQGDRDSYSQLSLCQAFYIASNASVIAVGMTVTVCRPFWTFLNSYCMLHGILYRQSCSPDGES